MRMGGRGANSLSLYSTDIWIDDLNVDPMTLNSATWYINLAQVVRVAHKIVIRLLYSVTTTTTKPINTCPRFGYVLPYTNSRTLVSRLAVDSYRFVYGAHLSSNRKRYHKMLPCNKHRNGFSEQIEKHREREKRKILTGGKAYFFAPTNTTNNWLLPPHHARELYFDISFWFCVSVKFVFSSRMCTSCMSCVYTVCYQTSKSCMRNAYKWFVHSRTTISSTVIRFDRKHKWKMHWNRILLI